jgi:hypothetical protein
MSLTAENLRERLHYNPETGLFTWLKPPKCTWISKTAGSTKDRYVRIFLYGESHHAHRLAWLYVYGEWPKKDIDHINRDGRDNRMANLRLASRSENLGNTTARKNNTTGFKGVCRHQSRFRAMIKKDGVLQHLGVFDTPQQAHAAYREAARELFGLFAGA